MKKEGGRGGNIDGSGRKRKEEGGEGKEVEGRELINEEKKKVMKIKEE